MGLLKKISVKIQSQFSPPGQASSLTRSPVNSSSGGQRKLPPQTNTTLSTATADLINSNSGRDLIASPNDASSWSPVTSSAHASPSLHTSPLCGKFRPGDKVKVVKNVDELRAMQEGHGGWNVKMVRLPFARGTVHRITVSGNVRVRFGDDETSPKFTINPECLAFYKDNYNIGDIVLVDEDVKQVKMMQEGHGEWIDQMESITGKVGSVIALDEDNDLQVLFDCQRVYTLNPVSVSLVPLPSRPCHSANTGEVDRREAAVASIYPTLQSFANEVQANACVSNNWISAPKYSAYECASVTERLKLLEDKFSEIEEVYSCNICMERVRKVIFMCGHGTCIKCSHSLTSCHMCRLPITRKIHLY